MRLKITENNIKEGKRWSQSGCPIARAIKHELKSKGIKNADVRVTAEWIYVNEHETLTPMNGSDFIERFDEGQKVQPITLTLSSSLFE